MARLGRRGRAWQAAISPGEPQAGLEPGIPEWGFPLGPNRPQRPVRGGNAGNGNILVPAGREAKRDPLSRGDRKGESPNQIPTGQPWGDVGRGPGQPPAGGSRSGLESPAVEGDSPVGETARGGVPGSRSTTA